MQDDMLFVGGSQYKASNDASAHRMHYTGIYPIAFYLVVNQGCPSGLTYLLLHHTLRQERC